MENPLPVQPDESLPETSKKKKQLAFSIFAGLLFGLFCFPALFVGAMISSIIVVLVFDSLNFFPQSTNLDFEFFLLPLILGAILSIVAGIVGGRRFYARSNETESARQVGLSMLYGLVGGLAGLLCFPVVCYAGYFLASGSATDNGVTSPLFLIGDPLEFGFLMELFICVPSVAILLAYLTAGLSSWIAYRRLDTHSRSVDQN